MRTSLPRGRRYSAISSTLLLGGVFFISFFGAVGYFALDEPAMADSLVAPTIITPDDGGVVNGVGYVQRWSSVPGAVKYDYRSYHDAAGLNLRYKDTYKVSIMPSITNPDATYWWQVRSVGSNGAVSSWSPLSKVIIDSIAPTTTLTTSSPAAAPNLYKTSPTITGTVGAAEKNLASHTFTVTNPNGAITTIGPISTASFTHSFTLDTSAGDGAYTISYSALDKAGNKSANIAPVTVVVDTTAPDAPVLTGDAARVMQPGDALHTWNLSAATDVQNYIFKSFSSAADAAAPDTATALATHTFSATQTNHTQATGTTDGTYWYRVAAVDRVGNQTWSAETYSVTVDGTAPHAPTLAITNADGPLVSGSFTKDDQVTVSWNKPSGDTVRYSLTYWNDNPESIWKQATPKTIEVTAAENWSGVLEGGDGTYSFAIQAIDHVGNASAKAATEYTLVLDTDEPVVELSEIADFTGPAELTVKGTVSDPTISTVQILLDGNVVGEASVEAGAFSRSLGVVAVGPHTVLVRAVDAAANDGEDVKTFTVVAVVVPPTSTGGSASNSGSNGATAGGARSSVSAPAAAEVAGVVEADGEVFNETIAQSTSPTNRAITGGDTNDAQEIKGIADTAGSGAFGSWWGWVLAAVVAVGGFWWLVAVKRRRQRKQED